MWALSLLAVASATTGFDPTIADDNFVAGETYTGDGAIRLWANVERHRDTNAELFGPQDFNRGLEWPADDDFAPFINEMFGTARPDSDAFLLHAGLRAGVGRGTPILFIPGAGDNASRGWATMVFRFDNADPIRPAYAMTFSHPHGDVFQQAEAIANAVARIKHLHGVDEVDLVAHSKGGIAAAIYLSHTATAEWGHAAYETHGTPYRGDVRRAVMIATPLNGVDTLFRWPANNYAALDAQVAVSPASWDTWYPNGVGVPLTAVDLSHQDVYLGGARDLFPGQRQILRPQDAPLPGSMPWLGTYALLQQDWFTTWNGGPGFVSHSEGIDAAVADGGDVISKLEAQGVDPAVELFLLAGNNPLLTNGTPLLGTDTFNESWSDFFGATAAAWSNLLGDIVANTIPGLETSAADVTGLVGGQLVLGEITAPSDGLVFVDSALHEEALTARGAQVVEAVEVNLAHIDLMYASPITGQLILDQVTADPNANRWMQGIGERYVSEDTLGLVERWLADPQVDPDPADPGDPADPADPTDPTDPVDPVDDDPSGPSDLRPLDVDGCTCSGSGRSSGPVWALLLLALARRNRVRRR
jgi:hypothetical protein